MTINGIPIHRLEEIELRLVGADHRPWLMSIPGGVDDEGRRFIMKGSKKAYKRAIRKGYDKAADIAVAHNYKLEEEMVHEPTMTAALAIFHRTENATDEMLDFVAHAPEDIEDLLREVTTLRSMLETYKEKSETAIKELTSSKVAASRAETKIADMRRAWRGICTEMGTKPT